MLNNMDKGVSLYLTIIIMSILLAIVLGLSAILVGQIKMLRGMKNSVVAFYAADTGIERALLNRANPVAADLNGYSEILDNGAEYIIEVISLPAPKNYQIRSVGTYQKTKRAIEISY